MKFIFKQWSDKSVTLMTENGYSLSTFNTLEEANLACQQWYKANGYHANTPQQSSKQDPGCSTCSI